MVCYEIVSNDTYSINVPSWDTIASINDEDEEIKIKAQNKLEIKLKT